MVRRIPCSGYVAARITGEAVHFIDAAASAAVEANRELRGSIMSVREIRDPKNASSEMLVQPPIRSDADASAGPLRRNPTRFAKTRPDYALATPVEAGFYEPAGSSLPLAGVDGTHLLRVLRQLEAIAKRQAPRIAFKAKGRIQFLDVAEIVAVRAEGNYVSLLHQPNPSLLRESLSSIAEKLKPYGFIRIHRSVVVNISAVEEIRSLPTGEYRLRIKGGKEYLVTRTYKENLRDLAQLWLGSERLPG